MWPPAAAAIFDLQQNLGHHSVAFTADVYGHLSPDHRPKESERLTGLFEAPVPAKVLPFPAAVTRAWRRQPRRAEGKQPSDRIFGVVNRHWVLRSVKRICAAAGVPVVPAHGLRGTHARLAVEAGISGDVVAASLGHESFATTTASYAGPDAVAGAAADRVADTLN